MSRADLEKQLQALGKALRIPATVAPLVLAQLDDEELERLRQKLLSALKALDFE